MNLREIAREFGISALVDVMLDRVRKGAGDIASGAAKKIKDKLTDEKRAELLAFLRELEGYEKVDPPVASKNLLRRQRDRQQGKELSYKKGVKYQAGSEDEFVTLLTKLFIALSDEEELESRIATFLWLGNMDDEEFDATLEFLKHDVVLQYGRKIPHVIREMLLEFKKLSEEFGLNKSLRKIDATVGGRMEKINDGLEKRWWVRSSKKKSWLPSIFSFLKRRRA